MSTVPHATGDERPRALVTLPDVGWPLDGGKRLRCAGAITGLADVTDVDVVVLFSTAGAGGRPVPPDVDVERWARWSPAPRHRTGAALSAVRHRWPWQVAAQDWERVEGDLRRWTGGRRYDLVWFGAMDHAVALAGSVHGDRTVVDLDDIETDKWSAYLRQRPRTPGQWAEHLQRRVELPLWGRVQQRAMATADAVVTCSEEDAARAIQLGARRAFAVPNTYPDPGTPADPGAPTGAPAAGRTRFVFVGNYWVAANRDAAEHLVADVLPHLRARCPEAVVVLIGRGAQAVAHLGGVAGVELVGEVDDPKTHLRGATAALVPVRFGGGTRLKALEAMAVGVPVVSTSLGTSGLGVRDGHEVLLADDPASFAAAAVRVARDPYLARRLAVAGRAHYEQRFTPAAAREAVAGLVADVLAAT